MASDRLIKIPLSPSLKRPVALWVKRFNDAEVSRIGDAAIKDNRLILNLYDIDFFIQLSNSEESNELDVQRLKFAALKELRASLKRRKTRASIKAVKETIHWVEKTIPGELHGTDISPKPWVHVPGYRMKLIP